MIKKVEDMEAADHQRIKFLVKVGDIDEIISYTTLCDIIEEQHMQDAQTHEDDQVWLSKASLTTRDPSKGEMTTTRDPNGMSRLNGMMAPSHGSLLPPS